MAPALAIGPHDPVWATREWRFEPLLLRPELPAGHLLVVPFAGDRSVVLRSDDRWSLPYAALAGAEHWQATARSLLQASTGRAILAVTAFGAIIQPAVAATVVAWAELVPQTPHRNGRCAGGGAALPHVVASSVLATVPLLGFVHELALAFRANACDRPCTDRRRRPGRR